MIITLCGSTRFKEHFQEWNTRLSLMGHCVFSLAMFGREAADVGKPADNVLVTDDQKVTLDLVHLAKIHACDAILILNVDGYTGFSTKREIQWARMLGKKIVWLERGDYEYGDLTSYNQGWRKPL